MRKIKVENWKAKNPNGEDTDEDTILALTMLLNMQSPERLPKGIEKFRICNNILASFEKGRKTGTLELEETEYQLLSNIITNDIPSTWGMNPDISQAMEAFLSAEKEK